MIKKNILLILLFTVYCENDSSDEDHKILHNDNISISTSIEFNVKSSYE